MPTDIIKEAWEAVKRFEEDSAILGPGEEYLCEMLSDVLKATTKREEKLRIAVAAAITVVEKTSPPGSGQMLACKIIRKAIEPTED